MELVWIVLLLGCVTLLGHGIWVGLARLFGAKRCPACGRRANHHNCPVCERSSPARRTDDLVRQRLYELRASGRLDEATHFAVLQALMPVARAVPSPVAPMRPAPAAGQELPLAEVADADTATAAAMPSAAEQQPQPPLPPARALRKPARQGEVAGPDSATRPPLPVPPRPVRPPSPPLHQALMAFAEKRNIRWGEIIGGLLIVGCSVALVISVWSTIAQYPLLKFGVFTAVLAALFGAGLYAEHRWKLPTTSRGVLVIAMLLVPLQFIAVAAMSAGRPLDTATLLGEVLSAVVLLVMTLLAARVLFAESPRAIALSFVLTAATVFLLAHALPPQATATDLLLATLPTLLVYLGGSAAAIWPRLRQRQWSLPAVHGLFAGMGLLCYAAVAAGLFILLLRAGPGLPARAVSPLVLTLGLPVMLCGLLTLARLAPTATNGSWQVGASAAAVGGTAVMLGSLLLAWPMPLWLLPIALVIAATLLLAALLADAPWAHLPAALLLVGAAMLMAACLGGDLPWSASADAVMASLLHSCSAWVLLGCSLACAAAALGLLRRTGRAHALAWGGVAAVCAAASLLWATAYTYGTAAPITWGWVIFAFYAVLLLAAPLRLGMPWMSALGWLLLLPVFEPMARPMGPSWLLAFYDVSVAALLVGTALTWLASGYRSVLATGPQAAEGNAAEAARVAWFVSVGGIVAGAIGMLLLTSPLPPAQRTLLLALSAGVLLAATLQRPSSGILAMAQGAAAAAAVSAALSFGARHGVALLMPRWLGLPTGDAPVATHLADAMRFGRPALLALAGLGLAWTLLRHLLARGRETTLLNPAWCADRLITALTLAGAHLLLVIPVLLALSLELAAPQSVRADALRAIGQAVMPATWSLLAVLLLNYLLETWYTRSWAWLIGAIAALWLGTLVSSLYAAPALATASVLRWMVCAPLVAGCTLVLARGRLARLAASRFAHWSTGATTWLRTLAFAPAAAAIVGLTIVAAMASLLGSQTNGPAAGTFFAVQGKTFSYLPPLVLLAAALVISGLTERVGALVLCGAGVVHLAVTLGALLNLPAGVDALQVLFWLVTLNGATALLFTLGWTAWWRIREPMALRPAGILAMATLGNLLTAIVIAAGALYLLLPRPSAPALLPPVCQALCIAIPAGAISTWLLRGRLLAVRELGALLFAVCVATALGVLAAGAPAWAASLTLLTALLAAAYAMLLGAAPLLARLNAPTAHLLDHAISSTPAGSILSYERGSTAPGERATSQNTLTSIHAAVIAFSLAAFPYVLRALASNPLAPWSAVAALALLALLLGSLAAMHLRRGDLYLATLPLLLAASVWWGWFNDHLRGHHWLLDLVHLNALCLAGAGAASLLLDRLVFRPAQAGGRGRPLHQFAGVCLTVLAGLSALDVLLSQSLWNGQGTLWLTWASLRGTLGLVILLLWDRSSALGLWLLYWTQFSMVTLLAGSLARPGLETAYLTLLLWILDGMAWLAATRHLPWLQRWGASPDAFTRRQTAT